MYAGRVACCPLVSHGEYADVWRSNNVRSLLVRPHVKDKKIDIRYKLAGQRSRQSRSRSWSRQNRQFQSPGLIRHIFTSWWVSGSNRTSVRWRNSPPPSPRTRWRHDNLPTSPWRWWTAQRLRRRTTLSGTKMAAHGEDDWRQNQRRASQSRRRKTVVKPSRRLERTSNRLEQRTIECQ